MKKSATIHERGNGFPVKGTYLSDANGELYVVVIMGSTIQTGDRPGDSPYIEGCIVESADWDDAGVEESECFSAKLEVGDEYEEPEKGAGYYAIDTGDGNELCNGLSEFEAPGIAQRMANERGEAVYLYEVGSGAEAEEIAPEAE